MSCFSAIKKFEIEDLQLKGAQVITSPLYCDNRGSLYESFHILKVDFTASVDSITAHYPIKNVIYGPVSRNGEELVYVIQGKLLVVLFDAKSKIKVQVELVPGKLLRIPDMCIHFFYSHENNSIYDIVRTSPITKEVTYTLDELGITFDNVTRQVSFKKTKVFRPDFAVMGYNGLIGSELVKAIKNAGFSVVELRSRLEQQEGIKNELINLNPKLGVIIAAGVGTRPNTGWCDSHKVETIDANVTCQLAVASICKSLNLHCTLISTCAFYHYDNEHQIGGKPFIETDKVNNSYNYYLKMREVFEELLESSGLLSNTLVLRANFPCSANMIGSNLISKLIKFANIKSIPNSISILPPLSNLAVEMIKEKEVGIVNWVCDGTITNGQLVGLYKKIVDPSHSFNEEKLDAEKSKLIGNAAAYVKPERLIKKFGERVPDVHKAAEDLMNEIKMAKI